MTAGKLQFKCPGCSQILTVASEHAGKTVACPKCQTHLKLPAPKVSTGPAQAPVAPQRPAAQTPRPVASAPRPGASKQSPNAPAPRPAATTTSPAATHPASSPTSNPFAFGNDSNPNSVFATQSAASASDRASGSPASGSPVSGGTATGGTAPQASSGKPKQTSFGRSFAGLAVASLVAGAFTILWLVIAFALESEIGILAWGLGGAIGFVAGIIGRNPSRLYAASAAMIAMGSVLAAKLVMALTVFLIAGVGTSLVNSFAELSPQRMKEKHALADEMKSKGEIDSKHQEFADKYITSYFSQIGADWDEDEMLEYEMLEEEMSEGGSDVEQEFEEMLIARLDTMTPEAKNQLIVDARRRHPEWIEDRIYYYAAIHQMSSEAGKLDEALSAHAKNELSPLNNEYDDNYVESIAPDEYQKRSSQLKELAAKHLVNLDENQRDQAVRDTLKNYPNWDPFPDAASAVMEQMVLKGELEGDLAAHGQAEVDLIFKSEGEDYYENTAEDEIESREKELRKKISEKLVVMDPASRKSAIKDSKSRYPDWSLQEENLEEQQAELKAAMDEMGVDGTFWGSLKGVFGLIDILWLFLGASTAYGVTKKYGQD